MNLHEVSYGEAPAFDGYGPGFFRVGGKVVDGAVLVSGARVLPWGGLSDHAPLLALKGEVDVLLLGTGDTIAHAPADLSAALDEAGLGVEVMASATACRTYNVLLGEGRRVAAAVLPTAAG